MISRPTAFARRPFARLFAASIVLALLTPVACSRKAPDSSKGAAPAPSAQVRTKTYAPIEIYNLIRSKRLSKADLLTLLGEPDFKGTSKGQELWQYYDLTQSDGHDGRVGKLWHQYFLFENDRVSYDWVGTEKGAPKE